MKKFLVSGVILGLLILLTAGPALAQAKGGLNGTTGGPGAVLSGDALRHFLEGDWELIQGESGRGARLSFDQMASRFYLEFYDTGSSYSQGHYGGRVQLWSEPADNPQQVVLKFVNSELLDGFQFRNLSDSSGPEIMALDLMWQGSDIFGQLRANGQVPARMLFQRAGYLNQDVELGMGPESAVLATLSYNVVEYVQYMNQGMAALYTGNELQIDGDQCFEVVLGFWRNDQFSPQVRYAVNLRANVTYRFDPLGNVWNMLGFG